MVRAIPTPTLKLNARLPLEPPQEAIGQARSLIPPTTPLCSSPTPLLVGSSQASEWLASSPLRIPLSTERYRPERSIVGLRPTFSKAACPPHAVADTPPQQGSHYPNKCAGCGKQIPAKSVFKKSHYQVSGFIKSSLGSRCRLWL